MGLGEFGGNGSVKWRVVHEDPLLGVVKNLAYKPGGGNPGDDEVTVAAQAEGKDPIDFSEIGVGKGAPAGYFRVTLRGHGVFNVEAVDRRNGRNANVPTEIRIEW